MQALPKRIIITFLLGGATGVIGQALVMLFAGMGFEGLALPMAVLLTLGIIGCLMVIFRVADKVEGTGASVALIAFYGLSMAMALAFARIRKAGGSPLSAFAGTWRFFAIALIPGIVIAVGTGVVWALCI